MIGSFFPYFQKEIHQYVNYEGELLKFGYEANKSAQGL